MVFPRLTGSDLQILHRDIVGIGVAVGVDGLFIETHPEPSKAKSDGANMLPLSQLPELLRRLTAIRSTIAKF